MIANALLAATAVVLATMFWLMQACAFLVPYRDLLLHEYGAAIGLSAAVLFLNLFAAFYAAGRWLFLKDTGEKLAHVEKQLRTGRSISEELSRLLEDPTGATRD
jgi:UPF0716 family protein affecting phage T7 exclusion